MRRDSSGEAPQPQSSPNVIVPRHSSETRSPLRPSNRYFMEALLAVGTSEVVPPL